jgi:hypothetical protein
MGSVRSQKPMEVSMEQNRMCCGTGCSPDNRTAISPSRVYC